MNKGEGRVSKSGHYHPEYPQGGCLHPPKMDKYPWGMHPSFCVKMNSKKFLVVFLLKTEQFKAIFEAQT